MLDHKLHQFSISVRYHGKHIHWYNIWMKWAGIVKLWAFEFHDGNIAIVVFRNANNSQEHLKWQINIKNIFLSEEKIWMIRKIKQFIFSHKGLENFRFVQTGNQQKKRNSIKTLIRSHSFLNLISLYLFNMILNFFWKMVLLKSIYY